MTCQEVHTNLVAYLQKKLSEEEALATARHLDQCPSCASELEQLRRVDELLDGFSTIDPSPHFETRLMAHLDRLEDRKKKRWLAGGGSWLHDRYAWTLAVLMVTTFGLWLGIRHQQYRELNSLQKVIEIEERYLGSSTKPKNPQSEAPAQAKEPTQQMNLEGQGISETATGKDEEVPEEDRALLENLDLLQNYEVLNSLEDADQQRSTKQRITD